MVGRRGPAANLHVASLVALILAHRAMYQSWRNATCHFSHFQLRRHLHSGYVSCTFHEAPPFTRIMTDPTTLWFEFGPGLIVIHWPDLEADCIACGGSLAGQDPPIKEQFPSPPSARFLSLFTLRALRSHTFNTLVLRYYWQRLFTMNHEGFHRRLDLVRSILSMFALEVCTDGLRPDVYFCLPAMTRPGADVCERQALMLP